MVGSALPDVSGGRAVVVASTGDASSAAGLVGRTSERTVKRLIAALLRKLRVSSRAEAAAVAGGAGIL